MIAGSSAPALHFVRLAFFIFYNSWGRIERVEQGFPNTRNLEKCWIEAASLLPSGSVAAAMIAGRAHALNQVSVRIHQNFVHTRCIWYSQIFMMYTLMRLSSRANGIRYERSPRAALLSLDAHVILERATRHARIFFWFGWWRVAYAMQYSLFNFNKVYFPLEIQDLRHCVYVCSGCF